VNPRAVIAEDEPLLAERLVALLGQCWPELNVVAIAPNGIEALAAVERERPDIAFLDIKMPGLTGLEVAAELADRLGAGEPAPAIVFVTAYDEHALQAFELAAFDYLLKPISEERLARTVARLKAAIARPAGIETLAGQLQRVLAAARPHAREPVLRHIQAGSGNTVRIIPLEEILYFRASDKYTSVATRDRREALIRTPLKELLERLPPERFRQIHRGTIVNLDQVAEAVRDDAGRVALRLKHGTETLAVSRVYAELFRQM
jgi:DNA-binding LytR/AlgR family response regulator